MARLPSYGCSQEHHTPNCGHFGEAGSYLSRHAEWCAYWNNSLEECTCNPAARRKKAAQCPYVIAEVWRKQKNSGEWVHVGTQHMHPASQPHSPKRIEYRKPKVCCAPLVIDLENVPDGACGDAACCPQGEHTEPFIVCAISRERIHHPDFRGYDWMWAQRVLQEAFELALIGYQ